MLRIILTLQKNPTKTRLSRANLPDFRFRVNSARSVSSILDEWTPEKNGMETSSFRWCLIVPCIRIFSTIQISLSTIIFLQLLKFQRFQFLSMKV